MWMIFGSSLNLALILGGSNSLELVKQENIFVFKFFFFFKHIPFKSIRESNDILTCLTRPNSSPSDAL